MFVTGENGTGNGPGEDWDPFTGVSDISADGSPPLEGFGAFTNGSGTYSFGIRERGDVDLHNARLFLAYTNPSDRHIVGFEVSYDVEVWLIGERANRIRLKLNTDSQGFSSLPDLVSTDNPRSHDTPDADGRIVDGTLPENRMPIAAVIDLAHLPNSEGSTIGSLRPGDTVYFRWQYSNAAGDSGSLRSALALNNVRIVPIYAEGEPPQPVPRGPLGFSHRAGFYTEPFELTLGSTMDGATIYYTVDGSEPDSARVMEDHEWEETPVEERARTFVYGSPIDLASIKDRANDISLIPTNEDPPYGEMIWTPPTDDVNKAIVVRALAVAPDQPPISETRTYFIEPEGRARYSLPVVSLSTDRSNLFGADGGIYVPGATGANYNRRGREWERTAYFELFDLGGRRVLDQTIGVRIHGGFTRLYPQKSLRLYSRSEYGTSRLSYAFFESKPNADFNRIILRNTGNDWGNGLMRDAALQTLVQHLPFETQHYTPVIVFINGEYWGLHDFRDRYDQHHLETHYGVPRDAVAILDRNANIHTGEPGDEAPYLDFIAKVRAGTLRTLGDFDEYMDVSGYIDYVITQMYAGNTDWPHNNVAWWRYKGSPTETRGPRDGRWRWLMFDVDRSLGFVTSKHTDMVHHLLRESDRPWARELFRGLLDVEEIRHEFLQRTAVHLATTFRPDHVRSHFESVARGIEPEVEEHGARWNRPPSKSAWRGHLSTMLDFAQDRPDLFRNHIISHFDEVVGTARVEITNLRTRSHVTLHSVRLTPSTPGVRITGGDWTGYLFTGIPVVLESTRVDLRTAEVSGEITQVARSSGELRFVLHGPARIVLP